MILSEVFFMNYLPTLEEIKKIADSGKYKIAPISCEILSDICTPIEALRKLKNVSSHCYLLDRAAVPVPKHGEDGREQQFRY